MSSLAKRSAEPTLPSRSGLKPLPAEETAEDTGWLLTTHSETSFRASLFSHQEARGTHFAIMLPYDFVWTTDDSPVFSKSIKDRTWENQVYVATGIPEYHTKSLGYAENDRTCAFSHKQVEMLANELAGELRRILTLLAH